MAFSSYAVPTIRGEIKRYFRDRTWSVHVPRDLQELALRVDRAVADLSLDLHRQPTVAEIAGKVGCEEEDVVEALAASSAYRATSLETPRRTDDDSGETLGETLGTEEPGFALAEDRAIIAQLTRTLSARERYVLRLRFEQDLTQAEIGEHIGVSQMQVSRVIRQALERLRSAATAPARARAHTGPSGRSQAENDAAPSLSEANDDAPSCRGPRCRSRRSPSAPRRFARGSIGLT